MKKKILLGALSAILLTAGFIAWKFFGPTLREPQKKFFYISTGETYASVRAHLLDSNIISGTTWFDMAARSIGYDQVKPGRYAIKKGMSVVTLVRMLRNGQQTPVDFVITRIRTREVLAARIGNAFETDSLAMKQFLDNNDSLRQFGLDSNTAMAVAMPFTYSIKWNTEPGKIFRQFYSSWESFWTDARKAKAQSLGLTPLQVSTMASIIEEETNAKTDKPNIASVYLNRIAKGMPLQADPTVKFAMRSFGLKRIYTNYTRFESPYNTYMNRGLPPGPICTPSLETIDAVLDAPKTDYVYFVASPKFDGTHVFTTNYEDHMKEARIYQQELNKRNIR